MNQFQLYLEYGVQLPMWHPTQAVLRKVQNQIYDFKTKRKKNGPEPMVDDSCC